MAGDLEYPHLQACLPRQGMSHPDTGRSLQSCIFIVQESGEGIFRLPEHPLIQDPLNGPVAIRFIKDITVRYGMPNSIITDNGTNFARGALAQYSPVSGTRLDLASVAHPQSNGQV